MELEELQTALTDYDQAQVDASVDYYITPIIAAARLVANPNILAAARSRYSEAERWAFTQKQWDKIMEETSQIVAAALTLGDTEQ